MTAQELTQALNWRYATKQFDADKRIPAETWQALEDSLVLAPSSFGLQPWKFIVITDSVLREQLKPLSWNQSQVTDASHFVVFAAKKSVTPTDVDKLINLTAKSRNADLDSLAFYRRMIDGFLAGMNPSATFAWTSKQTYIALGQFMTAAAALEVDTCPLEGITPNEFDKLLGLEDSEYQTIVACAAGYRHPDDKYASLPKIRYSSEELIARFD